VQNHAQNAQELNDLEEKLSNQGMATTTAVAPTTVHGSHGCLRMLPFLLLLLHIVLFSLVVFGTI